MTLTGPIWEFNKLDDKLVPIKIIIAFTTITIVSELIKQDTKQMRLIIKVEVTKSTPVVASIFMNKG